MPVELAKEFISRLNSYSLLDTWHYCARIRWSNCSQVSRTGIFELDGAQSMVPLLIRSSPSLSPSLRISKTTSALKTTLVVGMLISTSCFGNFGSWLVKHAVHRSLR
jgi:hypothetical protein